MKKIFLFRPVAGKYVEFYVQPGCSHTLFVMASPERPDMEQLTLGKRRKHEHYVSAGQRRLYLFTTQKLFLSSPDCDTAAGEVP